MLRTPPPPTGVKIPQNRGKRVVSTGLHKKNGDFLTQSTLFQALGKGSLLTPKPSFPDFGVFDPCAGAEAFARRVTEDIRAPKRMVCESASNRRIFRIATADVQISVCSRHGESRRWVWCELRPELIEHWLEVGQI